MLIYLLMHSTAPTWRTGVVGVYSEPAKAREKADLLLSGRPNSTSLKWQTTASWCEYQWELVGERWMQTGYLIVEYVLDRSPDS